MKTKRPLYFLIAIFILGYAALWSFKNFNFNTDFEVGQKIDSLDGIFVYYNGGVDNVSERNTTADGYNLGFKISMCRVCKTILFRTFQPQNARQLRTCKEFLR